MKCVIYRRVSTDEQANKGFSLENQKIRLESFATSQGWEIAGDYIDDGYSGKDMNRPALKRMFSDVDKFDVILVYKLDRFTRSVKDLNEMMETLQEHNIAFKSATESIDTTTATGRMILNMMSTTAQWERETISERIKDVLSKMREEGIFPTGKTPYGYRLQKNRAIVQVPEEIEVVKFVYRQSKVYGQRQIAKLLREKGIKTYHGSDWVGCNVGRLLHNPFYCGYLKVNGELVPIKNEGFNPVITLEEYLQINKLLRKRSLNPTRKKSDSVYPFSGIVLCPKCHKPMRGDRVRKKLATGEYKYYFYYKCGNAKNHLCDMKTITASKVDSAFVTYISGAFNNIDIQIEQERDNEILEKELKNLNNKIERAKELYIEGDISKGRYNEKVNKFTDRLIEVERMLSRSNNTANQRAINDWIRNIEKNWCYLDEKTKAESIRSIFDTMTIEVINGNVTVQGHTLL